MTGSRMALALAAVCAAGAAHGAVIAVGTPAELVDAVNAANADPAPDTVVLTADIELSAASNASGRLNGIPRITGALTIDGTGHEIRRAAAAPAFAFTRVDAGATLTLRDLTVRGFIANVDNGFLGDGFTGGAIHNRGTLHLADCQFIDNRSAGGFPPDGGAIFNTGALTVEGCTFANNQTASRGGAIYTNGSMTVSNSTFSGNYAETFGAAVMNFGTSTLRHVTVAFNTANVSNGGALASSGSLTVYNSLVAANTNENCRGTVSGGAGNLSEDTDCGPGFASAGSVAAFAIGPLQDNGGPTPTHALGSGSAAKDAGAPAQCLANDQRGEPRCDGACDVGAFERVSATQAQAITAVSATPSPGVYGGFSQLAYTPGAAARPVVVQSTSPAVCEAAEGLVVYLGAGTCELTLDQSCDATYLPAPQVTLQVPVSKAPQAISLFAATPAMGQVGDAVTLSAQGGGSGQAVEFASLTPATCSVASAQATLLGAGVCRVAANQAGDANHLAAPEATLLIPVARLPQTIADFAASASTAPVGSALTLSAVGGGSGQPVVFESVTPARCRVDGASVTLLAVGQCDVRAAQAGDANHDAATPAFLSLEATPGGQGITAFTATPNPAPAGAWVLLSAQGGASGQPVVFATLTPDTCSVLGNVARLLAEGTCRIAANQAGSADYAAAAEETLDILVQGPSIFGDGFDG